jgi:hypothetical protein
MACTNNPGKVFEEATGRMSPKGAHIPGCLLMLMIIFIIIIIIWFVRLLALRPLLAYCASLGC